MNFTGGMERRQKVSKSGAAEVETPSKGASNERHKARQTSVASARIEAPKAPAAPRALGTTHFAKNVKFRDVLKKCQISWKFSGTLFISFQQILNKCILVVALAKLSNLYNVIIHMHVAWYT